MSDPKLKRPMNPDFIVDPRSAPFSEPSFRGVLPHLEKPGCTYFATFCLADVAPGRDLARHEVTDIDDPMSIARETDFRPSVGSCILHDPKLARVVEESLLHFQGERYALSAWCVMPNHVHVVVTPYENHALSSILGSWKSFSAHEINRRLNRTGPVWQKESFDHVVRNAEGFEKFVAYTEQNPVAAGLVEDSADWRFCSARRRAAL